MFYWKERQGKKIKLNSKTVERKISAEFYKTYSFLKLSQMNNFYDNR